MANGDETHGPRASLRVNVNVGTSRIPIDILSFEEAVAWILETQRNRWETMVTPNLHHLRVVRVSSKLAERYAGANLSLADGWPVAWLATRISGRPVSRVAGADLFAAFTQQPGEGRPLVLVGGTEGPLLEDFFDRCRQLGWSLTSEPAPRAELDDFRSRAELAGRVARAGSGGIVVVGVGTPRQEELASEIAAMPGSGVLLCLGMSINFASGAVRRAPPLVRAVGLEWVYRALSEPRRLLARYIKDSFVLPKLALQNPRRR